MSAARGSRSLPSRHGIAACDCRLRPLIARSLAVEPCHDNLFRLPLALHRTLFRRRLVLYGEATLELSQPHRREVTLQQHLPNGTPDPVSREVEGREHRAPLNDADE